MKDYNKLAFFIPLLLIFLGYTLLLYANNSVYPSVEGSSVDRGKRIWQEKNCTGCHQIYGLGGYLGPDLTNVYSQKGPQYIKAFLQSGTAVMPDFHLSESQMQDVIQYLKSIDESGIGIPARLKINYDGTIQQPQQPTRK